MQLVYLTDKGNVRTTNQDSYCMEIAQNERNILALLCICDGMGGLEQGEVASGAAVIAVRKWFWKNAESFASSMPNKEALFASMKECIAVIHESLCNYSDRTGIRLGTTLSMIFLDFEGNHYYTAQVGDSRIYLHQRETICQITRDQTLGQRLYESGELSLEELKKDRRRSVLEQCIGQRSVVPVFQDGVLEASGAVILCSDGFYHHVTQEALHKALDASPARNDLKQNLWDLVREDRRQGETDNITVAVYRWNKEGDAESCSSLMVVADVVEIHTVNTDAVLPLIPG